VKRYLLVEIEVGPEAPEVLPAIGEWRAFKWIAEQIAHLNLEDEGAEVTHVLDLASDGLRHVEGSNWRRIFQRWQT
jgi:hypothetical protein